jgi:hypothetical protein
VVDEALTSPGIWTVPAGVWAEGWLGQRDRLRVGSSPEVGCLWTVKWLIVAVLYFGSDCAFVVIGIKIPK